VLAKLLVTPTPRIALVTGKAFAAGVRALVQALVVLIMAAILGVGLTANPLKLLGMCVVVILARRSSAACPSPSPAWCCPGTG
jgi:ABC-2 type transport system permease protein